MAASTAGGFDACQRAQSGTCQTFQRPKACTASPNVSLPCQTNPETSGGAREASYFLAFADVIRFWLSVVADLYLQGNPRISERP